MAGDRLSAVARVCAIGAVVLAPWLFGAAAPWAYLSVSLLACIAAAAWLLHVLSGARDAVRAPWVTMALVGLLALAFVQVVPLPARLVESVSPLAAGAQRAGRRTFESAGIGDFLPSAAAGGGSSLTLSASADATRHSLCVLAGAACIFLVTANAFRRWRRLQAAVTVLVGSSFVMAFVGVVHELSGDADVLWFHRPHYGGSVFGPFANPNHYALHMNVALGAAVGLLMATAGPTWWERADTWRERLASLSTRRGSRVPLLAFAVAVMGGSVCISLSRGGIVSLMVSLAGLALCMWLAGGVRRHAGWAAAAALLVLAMVVWLGWRPVVSELGTLAEVEPLTEGRMVVWRATLGIFERTPVVGTGFGTFQYVFPAFQPVSVQTGRWMHAHNDYVQLLAEGGLAAALPVGVGAALFVRHVARRLRRSSRSGRLLAWGLLMGLLAAVVHSALDFGLRIPANLFLFSAVAGMCVSALRVRKR